MLAGIYPLSKIIGHDFCPAASATETALTMTESAPGQLELALHGRWAAQRDEDG